MAYRAHPSRDFGAFGFRAAFNHKVGEIKEQIDVREDLLNKMFDKKVITEQHYRTLKRKEVKQRGVELIDEILPRRSSESLPVFLQLLVDSGQRHVAEIIDPDHRFLQDIKQTMNTIPRSVPEPDYDTSDDDGYDTIPFADCTNSFPSHLSIPHPKFKVDDDHERYVDGRWLQSKQNNSYCSQRQTRNKMKLLETEVQFLRSQLGAVSLSCDVRLNQQRDEFEKRFGSIEGRLSDMEENGLPLQGKQYEELHGAIAKTSSEMADMKNMSDMQYGKLMESFQKMREDMCQQKSSKTEKKKKGYKWQ